MHDHGECGVLGGLPGAGDADPVVDLDVGECGRGVVAQQDCRAGVEGRPGESGDSTLMKITLLRFGSDHNSRPSPVVTGQVSKVE